MTTVQLKTIDLAATPGHHHIAGTTTHWKHGYIPLDTATAARYHKKFGGSTFHRLEPEEFNGYNHMPKFIGEAKPKNFEDTKPVMKYKKNKILTGKKVVIASNNPAKDGDGSAHTVLGVSESKTHLLVQHADGTKRKVKVGDVQAFSNKQDGAADALVKFNQSKYKTATSTFRAHSSFKPSTKPDKKAPSFYVAKDKDAANGPSITTAKPHASGNGYTPDPNFPELKSSTNHGLNTTTALSSQEHGSLKAYTGSAYSSINSRLRSKSGVKGTGDETHVKRIDAAFGKAGPLQDHSSVMLHRGTNVSFIHELQEGDDYTEPGYSSTSRNPKSAFGGSTALHISLKPSAKALDVKSISNHPGENEVLLHRKTKFTVKKRYTGPSGIVHLFVEAEDGGEA